MMPWMIPVTITALMFKFMLGTDVGIINYLICSIGLISENIDWLTNTATALCTVIFANMDWYSI